MIFQTTNATIRAAYPNKTYESKETKEANLSTTQHKSSRIDQIKESIDSGKYRVNIQATAEKMVGSLL